MIGGNLRDARGIESEVAFLMRDPEKSQISELVRCEVHIGDLTLRQFEGS